MTEEQKIYEDVVRISVELQVLAHNRCAGTQVEVMTVLMMAVLDHMRGNNFSDEEYDDTMRRWREIWDAEKANPKIH